MPMEKLYVIENRTSPNGNIAYFWREGGSGYTANLDDAQLFKSHEADRIIDNAQGSHQFLKWELSAVRSKSFRAVSIDELRAVAV